MKLESVVFLYFLIIEIEEKTAKNHFQKNSDQKFASFYKTRKEPALKIDILSNILRLWIIHFHFCNSQFDWTRTIFRRQIFNHVHLWYIPDRQWERTLFREIVALRFLQRHHLFLFLFLHVYDMNHCLPPVWKKRIMWNLSLKFVMFALSLLSPNCISK